jgi:Transcription factor WhiB
VTHKGPGEWAEQARCSKLLRTGKISRADFDRWFFPTRQSTKIEITTGKDICALCPVRKECLQWAYATRAAHGTLGGLTANERLRVLRRADDDNGYSLDEDPDRGDQLVEGLAGAPGQVLTSSASDAA